MKKLSPEALAKGAGLIDKLKRKYQSASKNKMQRTMIRKKCGLYDGEFDRAVKYFNEEDLETGLNGVAKIES